MRRFLIFTALFGFFFVIWFVTLRIMRHERRLIKVFNVERAVFFWFISLEEIVYVPFLLMFFAVAQLWFDLEILAVVLKV